MANRPDSIKNEHRRYGRHWEDNARVDAMWSVLSLPEKLGGGWQRDEFFETGRCEITEVFRYMKSNGLALPSTAACVDFGCGLGRISQALAQHFSKVVGVDVSSTMIEQARAFATHLGPRAPYFVLKDTPDLSELGVQLFDMVYSNITLQHLNNELQRHYIAEFAKLLRPGGLAVFQIPAQRPIARFFATRNIAGIWAIMVTFLKRRIAPWKIKMEMNTLSEDEVAAFGRTCDLRLLKKPNIDWKAFYTAMEFRLSDDDRDPAREFPKSPLYFFVKQ